MPLTVQQLKSEKPDTTKTKKLFDGGGLYCEVTPTGSKRWRLKYRFGGKEKLISFGTFPLIGLKEAREKRDEAKRLLADGIDPSAHRRAERNAVINKEQNGFEVVAREWLEQQHAAWAISHYRTVCQRLQNDVFPFVGKMSVEEIKAPDLFAILRRIEKREAFETAHRVKTALGQIFRYAISTGRVNSDPTRDLKGALRPVKIQHLPAVTDPKRLGEILRILDGHKGGPIVSAALRLAPLVFVRPGELRQAEWNDFDLANSEWRFTVQKTKTPHTVPFSSQALEVLEELRPLTGNGRFVFPSPRSPDRPMSDNAILAALRSLGIPKEEMCGHGFRATARTLLDEALGFPPHLIEHQLAHSVRDSLGRAYNRTKHLPERKEMMQRWADYLDSLKGATT